MTAPSPCRRYVLLDGYAGFRIPLGQPEDVAAVRLCESSNQDVAWDPVPRDGIAVMQEGISFNSMPRLVQGIDRLRDGGDGELIITVTNDDGDVLEEMTDSVFYLNPNRLPVG